MFGALQKRQRLTHHNAVDRGRKPREGEGNVRTLAHQQLDLVTQFAHLIERRVLNIIERDKEASVARSLVHGLSQLRRRLGYSNGVQAHARNRRRYRQRRHFAIPRKGAENAIAKTCVRSDINHVEPVFACDIAQCVEKHGLAHATNPGDAQ